MSYISLCDLLTVSRILSEVQEWPAKTLKCIKYYLKYEVQPMWNSSIDACKNSEMQNCDKQGRDVIKRLSAEKVKRNIVDVH